MSDIGTVAEALADPIRRRILELLSGESRRTKNLAEEVGVSVSALSRHLGVLRNASLVERSDVDGDARGRRYRLRSGGVAEFNRWVDARWSVALAAAGTTGADRVLLGRMGAFLDGFAHGDVGLFDRHLSDDVVLIFPDTAQPFDKQGCLDSVAQHPPWVRYEIEPDPIVHTMGSHSLLTATAVVQNAADDGPSRVFISACFAETDPWRLVHLQWTAAAPTNRGAPDATI